MNKINTPKLGPILMIFFFVFANTLLSPSKARGMGCLRFAQRILALVSGSLVEDAEENLAGFRMALIGFESAENVHEPATVLNLLETYLKKIPSEITSTTIYPPVPLDEVEIFWTLMNLDVGYLSTSQIIADLELTPTLFQKYLELKKTLRKKYFKSNVFQSYLKGEITIDQQGRQWSIPRAPTE